MIKTYRFPSSGNTMFYQEDEDGLIKGVYVIESEQNTVYHIAGLHYLIKSFLPNQQYEKGFKEVGQAILTMLSINSELDKMSEKDKRDICANKNTNKKYILQGEK